MRLGRLAPLTLAPSAADPPGRQAGEDREASRAMNASVSHRRADMVAGFLCAFSFALSGIALVREPGLLATAAILVALVAVRMSEARSTLAAWAAGIAGFAFFAGMVVAVATSSPLF